MGLPCDLGGRMGLPCDLGGRMGLPCDLGGRMGLPCDVGGRMGLPCDGPPVGTLLRIAMYMSFLEGAPRCKCAFIG
jgi:hypothetical protein